MPLDKLFYNDFQPGQTDEYDVISLIDVGEPLMVKLKVFIGDLIGISDWFVDKVTVKAGSTTYTFPCYRWVQTEVVVFEGTGKILHSFSFQCQYTVWKTVTRTKKITNLGIYCYKALTGAFIGSMLSYPTYLII